MTDGRTLFGFPLLGFSADALKNISMVGASTVLIVNHTLEICMGIVLYTHMVVYFIKHDSVHY